ncbi:uncharacterized protein LOC122252703 [Penaeus japonicus]|uniref:uncharacterized protein LOC122252703 n=1 Tax=Penaeus japonicus TaxID=27405 RepID=UPI001C71153B|nr:uncharacterized protein LOC122252703 [Penaeus japonicus]
MIKSLSYVNKEKFPRKCEASSIYVDTTLGIRSCHERKPFLTHHAHKQKPSHSYTRSHSPESHQNHAHRYRGRQGAHAHTPSRRHIRPSRRLLLISSHSHPRAG